MLRLALAAVLVLPSLFVAREVRSQSLQLPHWTRAQMEAAPSEPASMRFVYGTLDPALAPRLRQRAVEIATRLFGADSAQVVRDRDATSAELAGGAIVLLGNPRQNAWTQRLTGGLPVAFTEKGFEWRGTKYEHSGDVLALVYPNPLQPLRFLFLVAPNSAAALGGNAGLLLGGDDWRISRDGARVRSGSFAQSPSGPWRYDASLDHDRDAGRALWLRGLRTTGGGELEMRTDADPAVAAAVRAAAARVLARLDSMGLAAPRGRAVTLTLYRSIEEKGEITLETRPESVDDSGAAHAAFVAMRETVDLGSVASARLVALGGSRSSRFLLPAGAWLAGREGGEPLERALARLYFGRVLPSATDAATKPAAWRSPLVSVPARALLARAVWESAPGAARRAALLSLLRRDPPGTLDSLCASAAVAPAAVARRYRLLADSLAYLGRASLAVRHLAPWTPADGFMSGVCVAHEPRLAQGYASAACARTLRSLREAGARWISLTAYGYLPEDGGPDILPSAQGGPDEENDEAIAEAAARAHALGLEVWLVPQLWSRGWPGELQYTPQGWQRFVDRYRAFLLHYALLADREGIEGLGVGHELASSTARDPQAWRSLISTVRDVYRGTLTYVAGTDEAGKVPFWDALDLVAVSLPAPPAGQAGDDIATLRTLASRALDPLEALSRRIGRPVLLAEAGCVPEVTGPVEPSREGRGAVDRGTQSPCDEALVRALEGREWVAGVLWRKQASSGGGWFTGEEALSPPGTSALGVRRAALKRWAGRKVRVVAAR